MNGIVYIGEMDRRVSIYREIKTKTETGFESKVKELVTDVWASREVAKSEEGVDDKIVAINEYDYLVRWNPIIANEKIQQLLLSDGSEEFKVYGVKPIGRKQYLKLIVGERE